jgi:glc operon protein GlcG
MTLPIRARGCARLAIVVSVLAACGAANTAVALPTQPVLTLEVARAIAEGCRVKAKAEGWKMNISIVDGGANVVLFERMDGAMLGSIEHANLKSLQAARTGATTRAIGDMAWGKDNKGGSLPGLAMLPGFVTFAGGLPITAGDALIGGVGVSGNHPDNDESCARAGLDAARDLLKR